MEEMIEEFKEQPIEVYVKANEEGYIIQVESSIFLRNTEGFIKIDEGFGDKFAHAQSQYFNKPLMNEDGLYNYKFENENVVEV